MSVISSLKIFLMLIFLFASFVNADSNQQILRGMVSVIRSLDTYLKGVYDFDGLVGENSEVNGDLFLCNYVMMSLIFPRKSGHKEELVCPIRNRA